MAPTPNETPRSSYRLSAADKRLLNAIMEHHTFDTEVTAIRWLIRQEAKRIGAEVKSEPVAQSEPTTSAAWDLPPDDDED